MSSCSRRWFSLDTLQLKREDFVGVCASRRRVEDAFEGLSANATLIECMKVGWEFTRLIVPDGG